jgi:hypothetical protein
MTAPKVPPNENAEMPRKMKVNTNTSNTTSIVSSIVNRAGEIPRWSRDIYAFLEFKYFIHYLVINLIGLHFRTPLH